MKYNPNSAVILNMPLNGIPDNKPRIVVWDTELGVLQLVDSTTNEIEAQIPGSGVSISIPTPQLKLSGTNDSTKSRNLYAYYLPTDGNDFLNHNPKYYLFMAKSNKRHKKVQNNITVPVQRPAGFYHPTHQNGINFPPQSAFYSGSTSIPLDTEFNLTPGAYNKTLIGFNPFQWTRYTPDNVNWNVPTLADFGPGKLIENFKVQGKRGHRNTRSALFCLAIGIENPDQNSDKPIIFSQLSKPFKLTFNVINGNVYGYNMSIQTSNITRELP